jgi:NAD-dependent dihydropyrimidine dehydrogenase PreA subunit
MILFFSGTGNSNYVAKRIADALGDALVNLNDRIKSGDTSSVETGERVIIVTPTYAWRIPRVVRDWLRKTELRGAKQVWFVMTCGSEIGNANKYNRDLCAEKAISCMGTAQIVMPENYIAMFSAPHADKARQIVAQAEPSIDRAIAAIQRNQSFAPTRNNLYDRFMSGPVNPIFYKFFVKADAFAASGACIGCGQCAKRCPMNNVTLKDGKPVWGRNCTHCMACICYCPKEAIEYGKKSVGQPRYHFEVL